MDIGSIMNNWIRELGFPVVKVTYSSNKETPDGDRSAYCGGILNFRQDRFNNSSAAAGGAGAGASSIGSRHNNGLWTIPIQVWPLTQFLNFLNKSLICLKPKPRSKEQRPFTVKNSVLILSFPTLIRLGLRALKDFLS